MTGKIRLKSFPCLLLLVTAIIYFVPAMLFSQPQVLPTVEIESDSILRAPLHKKQLIFPREIPADSLHVLVPREFDLRHKAPVIENAATKPGFVTFGMDSSFSSFTRISLWEPHRRVPLISLLGEASIPGKNRGYQTYKATSQVMAGKDLLLEADLGWQKSKQDSLRLNDFCLQVSNHDYKVNLGSVTISQASTSLALDVWNQHLGSNKHSDTDIRLSNHHKMELSALQLSNSLLLKGNSLGLATALRLPIAGAHAPELDLGLMTDFVHLLPVFDYHQRFVFKPDMWLEISNSSSLSSQAGLSLGYDYPYTTRSGQDYLSLTPLNLNIQAWRVWPANQFMKRMGLSHKLCYIYNEPQPALSRDSVYTLVKAADLLQNISTLELKAVTGAWVVEQNLQLNIENLPGSDYARKAHSPLLMAKTQVSKNFGASSLELSLEQLYLQKDANQKKLPAVIDLGLCFQTPITKDLSLVARIDNLFNTIHRGFGNLPDKSRAFGFTLRYLMDTQHQALLINQQ